MSIAALRSVTKDFPSALRPSLIKRLTGDSTRAAAHRVLRDVSFELNPGDFALLRGKNGSGKTTLLRILAGILVPTSGERIVNGTIAAILSPHAYFFGELPLTLSVEFAAACFGVDRDRIPALTSEFLSPLSPLDAGSKSFFLTPGQRTRLLVNLACNSRARLIVIDEALSLLDPDSRLSAAASLREFCAAGGAVLAVTHGVDIQGVNRELELSAGIVR